MLAISDIGVLLLKLLNQYIGDVSGFYPKDIELPCRILSYLGNVMMYMSAWLVVLVSIERVVAVKFPFKVKQLTQRHRIIPVLATFVVILLSNVYYVVHVRITRYDGTNPEIIPNEIMNNLKLSSLCQTQTAASIFRITEPIIYPTSIWAFHFWQF